METTGIIGDIGGYIGFIYGVILYWDNGKENGNDHIIRGYILGL